MSDNYITDIKIGDGEIVDILGPVLFDRIYPVGSIYMSVVNTNPSELFGGIWMPWGKGKVPVGVDPDDTLFDTAEEEGGSKNAVAVSHTHSLSVSTGSAGTHNHYVSGSTYGDGYHHHSMGTLYSGGSAGGISAYTMTSDRIAIERFTGVSGLHSHQFAVNSETGGAHTHTVSGNTGSSGESGTNKNLQPYITCYMWKRTA